MSELREVGSMLGQKLEKEPKLKMHVSNQLVFILHVSEQSFLAECRFVENLMLVKRQQTTAGAIAKWNTPERQPRRLQSSAYQLVSIVIYDVFCGCLQAPHSDQSPMVTSTQLTDSTCPRLLTCYGPSTGCSRANFPAVYLSPMLEGEPLRVKGGFSLHGPL